MESRKLILVSGILAMMVLAGCATPPERQLSGVRPLYATLPNGHDPLNPSVPKDGDSGSHSRN